MKCTLLSLAGAVGWGRKLIVWEESISLLSQSWFIQVPRKLLKPTKEFPSSFPFFLLMRSEISWFTGQPPSFACAAFYFYILLNGRLYRAVFWGRGQSQRRVPSVRMLWRCMARKWILNEQKERLGGSTSEALWTAGGLWRGRRWDQICQQMEGNKTLPLMYRLEKPLFCFDCVKMEENFSSSLQGPVTEKVKVAQSCPTLRPHGLFSQFLEFSRPEHWSG